MAIEEDLTETQDQSYVGNVSTVAEIRQAIDELSPRDRAELTALVWPEEESPPHIHEKLAEAAAGQFFPGDRANVDKILDGLQ